MLNPEAPPNSVDPPPSLPQIKSPSMSVSIVSQEAKVATRRPPALMRRPPAKVEVAVAVEVSEPPVMVRPFEDASPAAEIPPAAVDVPVPARVNKSANSVPEEIMSFQADPYAPKFTASFLVGCKEVRMRPLARYAVPET